MSFKGVKYMVLCALVVIMSLLFSGSASARDDWGYMMRSISLSKKLNEKFSLKFLVNFHAKEEKKPFYYR